MPRPEDNSFGSAPDRAAADWVARRDRGLTAAEQDEYLQWLREDSRRGALVARHEATLRRMQALASWQPAHSRTPNPDLFAPAARRHSRFAPWLAAAAAMVVALWVWQTQPEPRREVPAPPGKYLRINERQVLADGSVIELRDGSQIEVTFSARERRVRLAGGEAHFRVAHEPDRPFIVEAGGVVVRAVGTAFNVRLEAQAVDVLVTEGKVRVETAVATATETVERPPAPVLLSAHERTLVPRETAPMRSAIVPVTAAQVKEALGWQAPRLQFHETPLAEAVAEFNRHNSHQLVLGDPRLGATPIGGTFRVDNVDAFVRLLAVTLDIRGESRGPGETVLTRQR